LPKEGFHDVNHLILHDCETLIHSGEQVKKDMIRFIYNNLPNLALVTLFSYSHLGSRFLHEALYTHERLALPHMPHAFLLESSRTPLKGVSKKVNHVYINRHHTIEFDEYRVYF